MRKLKTRDWLLSTAAMLGVASSASAQSPSYVQQADALFRGSERSLVQQIQGVEAVPVPEVAPENPGAVPPAGDAAVASTGDCLDIACDANACDAVGCSCYLFGPSEAWDLGNSIFCEDSGYDIGGWLQFGYHSDNDGVFNTHPGSFDAQQIYLYGEKKADGSNGLGFGGRVDLLYGTDASNTQSFGNDPGNFDYVNGWDHGIYGWAMPQLYAEVAYDKLSVKAGHFYTLLGYQVVPATGNFFYSIPYTFNFSEAFTHTGVLATYSASDNVTLYGGWTLGWDTGYDQFSTGAFNQGGNSFLGGASVGVTDDVTATYILTAGNLGWIGEGYTHSFVVDYKISDKWEYVFQSDLVGVDDSVNSAGGHYDTIGVNQYLFYTINDCTKAGARVEWWKADGQSLYEMAYGINYKPMANLTLRPEVRYNWTPNETLPAVLPVVVPANATTPSDYDDNLIFGIDAIVTF